MEMASVLASATAGATGTKADQDRVGLSKDFDQFLTLLTTQLKYQDPLEPMDSTEFVNQLVQFSGVEQSITTNKNLEQLLTAQNASATTGALNYIGKSVEAESSVLTLENGSAEISYGLAGQSAGTKIIVLNSAGNAVASSDGETAAGKHYFTWDGKDADGAQLPDGAYKFVVVAQDKDKGSIQTATATIARVSGVESTQDGLMLSIGATQVSVSKIVSVREPPSTTPGT